jgi:hypothetical protein
MRHVFATRITVSLTNLRPRRSASEPSCRCLRQKPRLPRFLAQSGLRPSPLHPRFEALHASRAFQAEAPALMPGPWPEVGSESRAYALQAPNLLLRPLVARSSREAIPPARPYMRHPDTAVLAQSGYRVLAPTGIRSGGGEYPAPAPARPRSAGPGSSVGGRRWAGPGGDRRGDLQLSSGSRCR